MRTGQLSAQSGVKLETIRYYERVGLRPAPPLSAAGYREYQLDHLQRLLFLRRSRQLVFSIAITTPANGAALRPGRPQEGGRCRM